MRVTATDWGSQTPGLKLLDGGLRDGGWTGEGRPTGGHALDFLDASNGEVRR
jgi:hypothetical protein